MYSQKRDYGFLKGIKVLMDKDTNAEYVSLAEIERVVGWLKDSCRLKLRSKSFCNFCNGAKVSSHKMSIQDSKGRPNIQTVLTWESTKLLLEWATSEPFYKEKHHIADNPEKQLQNKIASDTGGVVEVQVPTGRIDILTKTHIIEIKNAKGWKGGIGQLMAYSPYYPSHKLWLVLFGEVNPKMEELILDICNAHKIKLTVHR